MSLPLQWGAYGSLTGRVCIFESKMFNEFAFLFVSADKPFCRICEVADKAAIGLVETLSYFGQGGSRQHLSGELFPGFKISVLYLS